MFFDFLKRKTNTSSFIPQIDGLRFLAIITVVLYHLNTALTKELGIELDHAFDLLGGTINLFSLGWWLVRMDLGVKIFFSISGFVLAIPFLKFYLGLSDRKISIKDYFFRRLVRLEPPFIISLLAFSLIHYFILNKEVSYLLKHLGAGLMYLHVFIFGQPNPINPVSWSLETEAQFYCFVPIIFYLFFRLKSKFAFFLLILFMFLSAFFRNTFPFNAYFSSSILTYFVNFGVGIMFAWLYLVKGVWINKKNLIFDFLGIVAFISLFYFYKPQHTLENIFFFNISVFIFFVAVFKSFVFSWFFSRKIIFTIGGMCYSIYLLHYAFFHLSVKCTLHFWSV